ncbi:hypothetical protein T439DRAFT_356042 [Meredithblackwellia eburnea MCA 4105]
MSQSQYPDLFRPNRSLLNPKFQSYKLSPSSSAESDSWLSFPATTPVKLRPIPDNARLSYVEVRDRVGWNHLYPSSGDGAMLWVDGDGVLGGIGFDEGLNPTLHTEILSLPSTISSSTDLTPEYPVILPLTSLPSSLSSNTTSVTSPSLHLISDGLGMLHLVHLRLPNLSTSNSKARESNGKWSGQILRTWEFTISGDSDVEDTEVVDEEVRGGELKPFRLREAHLVPHHEGGDAQLRARGVISITVKSIRKEDWKGKKKATGTGTGMSMGETLKADLLSATETRFELVGFELELPALSLNGEGDGFGAAKQEDKPEKMAVRWKIGSKELPLFVRFEGEEQGEDDGYIIGSGDTWEVVRSSKAIAATLPSSNNRTTSITDSAPAQTSTPTMPRPPPYSWTQDPSSLTVAFAIPSSTPASSIRITFTKHFLTLHVASAAYLLSSSSTSTATTTPHISHRKFWAPIDPHTSLWTFDREAEGRDSSYGVLTLHLEKADEGTRWSLLFAEGEEEGEVRETLDPSELAAIVESMEKYTKEVEASEGTGGVGVSPAIGGRAGLENLGVGESPFGGGIPTSLQGDEMDVEVDAEIGKAVLVTWVSDSGGSSGEISLSQPNPAFPHSLLSIPLPFRPSSPTTDFGGIIIKNDVDGLLFHPPSQTTSSSSTPWTHTSTFPALAFVLATKRDASFIYHIDSRCVLAFDIPSATSNSRTASGGGNLFVYWRPEGTKDVTGRQRVVRISSGLLGVAGIKDKEGKLAVVMLCESGVGVCRLE